MPKPRRSVQRSPSSAWRERRQTYTNFFKPTPISQVLSLPSSRCWALRRVVRWHLYLPFSAHSEECKRNAVVSGGGVVGGDLVNTKYSLAHFRLCNRCVINLYVTNTHTPTHPHYHSSVSCSQNHTKYSAIETDPPRNYGHPPRLYPLSASDPQSYASRPSRFDTLLVAI